MKADEKTLKLIEAVNKQKAEIARLDKPNWKTNCTFSRGNGDLNGAMNIKTMAGLGDLAAIAGFLLERQRHVNEGAKALDIAVKENHWNGYPIEDWLSDLKTRVDKLQIATKRSKLEALESRLNAIISPELRAQLELEAIEAELSGS